MITSFSRKRKSLVILPILILLLQNLSLAQNAGTLITAKNGMVVSASDEASKAGVEILKKGGNAIDAAVAVGFTLAVTYPAAGNIGGGMYMVIRLANGKTTTIDAREAAPNAAHRDMYLDPVGKFLQDKSLIGPLAAGVPGTVDGLLKALSLHGKLKREVVMKPAISLAENGFPLHKRAAALFESNLKNFERFPSSMNVFSKSGGAYAEKEVWKQPDLAQTLKLIREQGREGFYKGSVAEKIVAQMKRGGGLITLEDLRRYVSLVYEPVIGTYKGYEVISVAPSSSGGISLVQMLNILEQYDLKKWGHNSFEAVQHITEAIKYVYADRAKYLGDPDFTKVPMAWLTSKEYAASIRAKIIDGKATPSAEIQAGVAPAEGKHTTHYSVVDKWGNAVSVTTTINSVFGSKCVVDGAGFLLNNEMDDFSAKPGVANQYGLIGSEANAIAPGKRMLSSMTPTILTKDGKLFMLVGTPGGSMIITNVLQTILNVIEFGMNAADAVRAKRFHHQWLPDELEFEKDAFTPDTKKRLHVAGYDLHEVGPICRVEMITIDAKKKILSGCSDPRGYGSAIGY